VKKVVFIDTVHPILAERLSKLGYSCEDATNYTEIEVKKSIKDAFGIVIRAKYKLNEDFLKFSAELGFIARSGSGLENIDVDYCNHNNIAVFNSPEGNRNAVAEHGLGMLLSLFNRLNKGDQEVRNGIWNRDDNRGIELDGKTIGLIGYGNNGSAFAKKLEGFDCRVLAYDKYKQNFSNRNVIEASMEEIFTQAEVLSFHVPLTEETNQLFGEAFIEKFHQPFYLLNLARGKIVHTKSLVEGLKSGKVLGACLDVLEYEPSDFSSFFTNQLPEELCFLFQQQNVLFSPHVAGWTHESYYKLSAVLADKIEQTFHR
jgi:D-3-phosphoglycerate dehydrogenase